MPYPSNAFFEPSGRYKETWTLVPQVRTITVSSHKTKSMYSDLSPAIPVFYVLMVLAIAFDVYLGFAILSKQGVNIALIIGSVFFDLLLAIAPFLFESFLVKEWNHVRVENQIFLRKLQCKTKKIGESETEFDTRRSLTISDLGKYESYQSKGKLLRIVLATLIFVIAGWKIYTFYKVLPPGMSIFSLVNGKIVIIFSLLCAIFHLIGSEKAFAHFMFWTIKDSEFKLHQETHNGQPPQPSEREIEYLGDYKDTRSGNSSILHKNGQAYLTYIYVIRDEEIQDLINAQTSEEARRGVAIKCKENQLI